MFNIKFHSGSKLPTWAVVQVKLRSRRNTLAQNETDLGRVVGLFSEALAVNGLTVAVQPQLFSDIEVDPQSGNFSALDNFFRSATSSRAALVYFILGDKDTQTYNKIKFLGDIKYGIHSVCSVGSKLFGNRGASAQYFANVALKFNLKLGGTNQIVDKPKLGIIGEGKTMIIGLDVTHPSPGSSEGAPSVAGIVASVDVKLGQWPAAISVQTGRQEMVAGLKEMVKSRLVLWRLRGNRELPENLLVYRDGVSEGQYQIVIDNELPLIREACRDMYSPSQTSAGLPKISILVVGKRHHTRFYPTQVRDADIKSSNPMPGTVVDRVVTEARNWDFFLQAHAALHGTARPAHYVVILDEIFSGAKRPVQTGQMFQSHADTLENLTHNMCYLFGRATKAVSICPPAYYADLVCERARCYLSGVFDPTTPPETFASGRSGDTPTFNPADAQVHDTLKDTMFYI